MKASFHRVWMTALTSMALAIPVASPSFAQGAGTASDTTSGAPSKPGSSAAGSATNQSQQDAFHMRASQLIGKEVTNREGQNLGEIQNLFVDGRAQRVHYAVLSFGGFLGLGDKLFAFPMDRFNLTRDRGELVLNEPQERLRNAPGFERDTWPNYGDPRYFGEVSRYFGEDERQTLAAARGMMRGTELMGRDVNDRSGRDAGEVQDFVVDINTGRIAYVVLDFDEAWSLDDKLLPLPLSAFTFPRERGAELVLNLDRNRLDMARGFESNLWPDLNEPAFRQNMQAYFLALERPVNASGSSAEPAQESSGTTK